MDVFVRECEKEAARIHFYAKNANPSLSSGTNLQMVRVPDKPIPLHWFSIDIFFPSCILYPIHSVAANFSVMKMLKRNEK